MLGLREKNVFTDDDMEKINALVKVKITELFRIFPDNQNNFSAILKYANERIEFLNSFRESNEFKTIRNYRLNYYAEMQSLDMFLNYTIKRFREMHSEHRNETEVVDRIILLVKAFDEIVRRNTQKSKRPARVLIPATSKTEEIDLLPRIARNWKAGWPKK
jgi:hypothetical protein